jgi:two-component system chemotaxis sensor kinase CheA
VNPLLDTFLAEAAELLGDVDAGLLRLEREPDDLDLVNQVFRATHTIKGSAGLFGFTELIRVTHAAEDLLDAVRGGDRRLDAELADGLLAAFDLVRRYLAAVTTTGKLPADAAATSAEVIARLRWPAAAAAVAIEPAPGPAALARCPEWTVHLGESYVRELADWLATTTSAIRLVRYSPAQDCYFRGEDPLLLVRQLPGIDRLVVHTPAVEDLDTFNEFHCDLEFVATTRASVSELAYLLRYVPGETEVAEVGAAALLAVLEPAAGTEQSTVDAAGVKDPEAVADAWFLLAGALSALAAGSGQGQLMSVARSARTAADLLGLDTTDLAAAQTAGEARDALRALLAQQMVAPTATYHPEPEPAAAEPRPGAAPPALPGAAPAADPADHTRVGSKILKVDQDKVDRLVDLVGELIVAKNALPFLAATAEEEVNGRRLARQIKDEYAVLHRIAEDLRGGVMGMRMLPFSVAFAGFPRLVRDLGRRLDKHVELVTEGDDTAADKDIIEALADPLVHLVRNSLDHGVEHTEDRVAAGKSPHATVRLQAMPDGDAVVVEVSDDGRGIDPAAVRRTAYERGVISEVEVETMSDTEAVDLIFRPGFSTAAAVSEVSGRGVGMDAVRASVERLGGTVTLRSTPGQGSLVRLRLPLSMAVAQVMVFSVAGQRFGIPVEAVVETARVPRSAIRRIVDQDVFVLRDEVVPVVDLAAALRLGWDIPERANLMVVGVNGHKVALVVERFHREIDAIVRPLDGVLAASREFAGTALLGDGMVLLILDLKEVVRGAARAA